MLARILFLSAALAGAAALSSCAVGWTFRGELQSPGPGEMLPDEDFLPLFHLGESN